jgi:signal transduction histidine kinase
MSGSPFRARIAPVAFVVVLVFVLVGFFRVDREMVRAERDRAAVMASETASLIEVFLLRHSEGLHRIERSIARQRPDGRWLADSTAARVNHSVRVPTQFDAMWVLDSVGAVSASLELRPGAPAPLTGRDLMALLPASSRKGADAQMGLHPDEPSILTYRLGRRTWMLFTQPLSGSGRARLVGSVPNDSLAALIERQQRAGAFGTVVEADGDTILAVAVPSRRTRNFQSTRDTIVTPAGYSWTVSMIYSPSGRGVRIALWVVGLGAVVGLGVGLLLERREVNRIAGRSSELEHLSAELLRANRAKSEFLANVSHELRTPLNAIVGFVDLLRDGVYGALNARQVGPVERIEASANHLRHLVDQVLDLAKMAAGRLEVHAEPLELRPFVFDVASEVEPLITEKGLSFSLAVGASLPRVRTDPTHLRQILINLLGNAVKFTSNGGISVRGKLVGTEQRPGFPAVLNAATALLSRSPRPDGLWVALQVADSGVGIPEKDRERIFDEFEQVNAGPRGDSMRRGTGLGLSISRRLARLLGGDITVESELGRGSVFTIWLPVDPADLRGDRAA